MVARVRFHRVGHAPPQAESSADLLVNEAEGDESGEAVRCGRAIEPERAKDGIAGNRQDRRFDGAEQAKVLGSEVRCVPCLDFVVDTADVAGELREVIEASAQRAVEDGEDPMVAALALDDVGDRVDDGRRGPIEPLDHEDAIATARVVEMRGGRSEHLGAVRRARRHRDGGAAEQRFHRIERGRRHHPAYDPDALGAQVLGEPIDDRGRIAELGAVDEDHAIGAVEELAHAADRRRNVGDGSALLAHRLGHLAQQRARRDPELAGEKADGIVVDAQRLRVVALLREGLHQLRVRRVAQRLGSDDRLERAHDVGVVEFDTEFVMSVEDVVGERHEANLFGHDREVVGEVGEGLAPQCERVAEQGRGFAAIAAVGGREARGRESLELPGVDVEAVGDAVAALDGGDRVVHAGLVEGATEMVDVDVERLAGRRRLVGTPHRLAQCVGGDEFVRVEREPGQQSPLESTPHLDRRSAVADTDRSEHVDPVRHPRFSTT
ncbi:MAG: hypothetical protein AAF548_02775 [Actinomycetota bacterium]